MSALRALALAAKVHRNDATSSSSSTPVPHIDVAIEVCAYLEHLGLGKYTDLMCSAALYDVPPWKASSAFDDSFLCVFGVGVTNVLQRRHGRTLPIIDSGVPFCERWLKRFALLRDNHEEDAILTAIHSTCRRRLLIQRLPPNSNNRSKDEIELLMALAIRATEIMRKFNVHMEMVGTLLRDANMEEWETRALAMKTARKTLMHYARCDNHPDRDDFQRRLCNDVKIG